MFSNSKMSGRKRNWQYQKPKKWAWIRDLHKAEEVRHREDLIKIFSMAQNARLLIISRFSRLILIDR